MSSRCPVLKPFALAVALVLTASVNVARPDSAMETYELTTAGANLLRSGNYTGARDKLALALKNSPASYDATFYMAMAYERAGDTKAALDWYSRAVPLNPKRHEALLSIARIYYDGRDYVHALPMFEDLAKDHPASDHNYEGYLALARCYAETGQLTQAVDTFKRAIAVKPDDPEGYRFAAQEFDYLSQFDLAVPFYTDYLKRFAGQSDAQQMQTRLTQISYAGQQKELLREVREGFRFDSDTEDLHAFVTFLDPNHTGVSNDDIGAVLMGLKNIPRTYRHQLENAGYKVLVVPSLLDALPELAGQTPRGFGESASWHNANGTFDRRTKTIIVAVKIQLADGRVVTGQLDETVEHEFGHAYDHYIGLKMLGADAGRTDPEISQSPRFSSAYDLDVKQMPANLRPRLAYFLQPGAAGKEELFAQMFPIFFGNPPYPGSYEELFGTAFPNVLRLIAEARKSDPDYENLKDMYDAKLRNNLMPRSEAVRRLIMQQ